MPIATLSAGSLERILQGDEVQKPIFQVLGAKMIAGGTVDRLRLLVSDGKHYNSYAMLATQLNHLHADGKLSENSIVQIDKYITSTVNKTEAKRVLVILELTVLNSGEEVGHKIGNPVIYTESAAKDTNDREVLKPQSNNHPIEKSTSSKYVNNNDSSMSMNQSINTGLTQPISFLSPYQNKWVIKARVTSKSGIRTWSNAKGEGKLFSMDLVDESGEIRATAFKQQCDKFFDLIQPDSVYYISKCQIKPANKQFSSLKNDYEITFTSDTVVQLCEDETGSNIPEIKFDLVPISELSKFENKASADVLGICKEIGEVQTFTSRNTNKEFKKREIVLIDQSNASINLTVWGDDAVNFNGQLHSTILVKGGRINEFNGGKSLSMSSGSLMKVDPDIPESTRLRTWFENGGGNDITNAISSRTGTGGSFNTEWLSFLEAQMRNLGGGDKADYFQCKATIHVTRHLNAYYKACSEPECNKKLIDSTAGHYRCERCNRESTEFKYRLLFTMSIADWTSNRWVTCFNDQGEQLLKCKAQEVGDSLENAEKTSEEVFSPIHFHSFIFKLRAKTETFGDSSRNKIIVQSVAPINYKEYNKYLISNLNKLTGIHKI